MNESSAPLPQVDPGDLTTYLLRAGWTRRGTWRGAGVWRLEHVGEVLVPPSREFPDDEDLLKSAIQHLAQAEDRSIWDITLDVTEPSVDVQIFRTMPATSSGTIPLAAGKRAISSITDLMQIAAKTLEHGPQSTLPGQSSHARPFLDLIRLGTTRPGSYILTTRVTLSESSALPERDGLPYSRHALVGLHQAIRAAHAASGVVLTEHRDLEVFEDFIERGVSANLCAALAGLGGAGADRPFDVTFTWSRAFGNREPSEPIRFSGEMASIVSQAGRHLKKWSVTGEAEAVGTIVDLHDEHDGYRFKLRGDVRAANVEGSRTIWVAVSEPDYLRVVELHRQRPRPQLRVRGQLSTNRGRIELRPDENGVVVGDG